jgi:hypothetical protein
MVMAIFSVCIIKQSTVEAYYGVEVYLHAFFTTASDGNVLLTSKSPPVISPHKQPPVRTEYEAWLESTMGHKEQEKGLLPLKGTEPFSYRP